MTRLRNAGKVALDCKQLGQCLFVGSDGSTIVKNALTRQYVSHILAICKNIRSHVYIFTVMLNSV